MSNKNKLPIYPKLEIKDNDHFTKSITTYVYIQNKGNWLVKYVKFIHKDITKHSKESEIDTYMDKVANYIQDYCNDIEELKSLWRRNDDLNLPNKFKNLEYIEDNIQRLINPYYDLNCTEKICETVKALKTGMASGDIVLDVKTHIIIDDIKHNENFQKDFNFKWENTLNNE